MQLDINHGLNSITKPGNIGELTIRNFIVRSFTSSSKKKISDNFHLTSEEYRKKRRVNRVIFPDFITFNFVLLILNLGL